MLGAAIRRLADCSEIQPAEITGRPHGGTQGENWQRHCDSTILAGCAPQENGHPRAPGALWGSRYKTKAKLSRRTSIIFGGDLSTAIASRMMWRLVRDRGRATRGVGHTGLQSRPEHVLILVDLFSPLVTVDFKSLQVL